MEDHKFSLVEDVFLVTGAKRAALYNLRDGNVYSIDHKARKLLELCESGMNLNRIIATLETLNENDVFTFLDNLTLLGLGRYVDSAERTKKALLLKEKRILDFIWLEITEGCNLKCVHCYANSAFSLIGSETMTINDWISIISQSAILGCRKLQFIGGEPLLLGDKLISLIKSAKEKGFTFVEVFTNATFFPENIIESFLLYGVCVAVSFYSANPNVHDSITLRKNSHARTVENIKKLIASGIKVRIAIIGMKQNQDGIEETKKYINDEFGIEHVGIDVIRPSGRGKNNNLIPDKLVDSMYIKQPMFPNCTAEKFIRWSYGHNCFSRAICVVADGNVYPCIMERSIKYGNVLDASLYEILNLSETEKVRKLSKDHIKVCKDCEYRYACFDCRPRAMGMSHDMDFYTKPKECLYLIAENGN